MVNTEEDPAVSTTRRAYMERWHRMFKPSWRLVDLDHECLAGWRTTAARVLTWNPRNNDRGLLLAGPTGKGKTRVCAQLLGDLMEMKLVNCSLWPAQKLVAEITELTSYGSDCAETFISQLSAARVLFIDDLGQEGVVRSQDARVRAWLFRLIDLRCASGARTVVTTNLTAQEIVDGFGELRGDPLLRRLAEMCEVIRVA